MSAFGFALGLGLIAFAAIGLTIAGVKWAERQPADEPIEHGDGEP
jgi:hypothetical protein